MYLEEDAIVGLILLLVWAGIGIWIGYITRKSSCGIRFLVLFLFTKGVILFWIPYGIYALIKNFKEGMKEGNIEKQQKVLNNKEYDKEKK